MGQSAEPVLQIYCEVSTTERITRYLVDENKVDKSIFDHVAAERFGPHSDVVDFLGRLT